MERSIPLPPLTQRSVWLQALPIVFGYLPVAIAFGILANKAGISTANTLAMSLLVYAGSAQLISVTLIAAGISPWSIILTTFVVNLRHLLMSAALSPYVHSWQTSRLAVFAFELTDETFALHSTRFPLSEPQPHEVLSINVIAQSAWVFGTWVGVVAGGLITDVKPFGLDYALLAMFIALLILQIKDRRTVAVAVLGGLLSTALLMAGVSQWNVIIAALIAATFGVFINTWTKPQSS